MQHWLRSGWQFSAVILISSLALFLAGCGGGSKSPNAVGNVATVTISPAAISMNAGDVITLNVSALDASKKNVFNQTFSYSSSNPNIQISNTGLLCGGTWDSLTTPINCRPLSVTAAGTQSTILATVQGIKSNSVIVSVHLPITSIAITPASPACVSQNGVVSYSAQAFSGATNITSSVGSFTWNIGSTTIGTLSSFFTSGTTATADTVTAKLPGVTQVSISANTVNPVSGVPATFAECPVASVSITPAGTTTLSGAGKTQQYTATVTDSLGAAVTGETVTWSSSQTATATVGSTGLVTAVAAGHSSIIASCAPSSCNLGYNLPVYSNLAVVTVSGSSPATTVYATCGNPCAGGLSPAFPLVPISTSNNTAGTAISLPEQPLSLTTSNAGDKVYIGGLTELMILDTATNTITSQVTNAPGVVLAVSPDGNSVITDGYGSNALLFNISAKSVTGLGIAGATAASFAPDGSKAYLASGSNVYLVQPGVSPFAIAVGSAATDVAFLASGPVAYIAAAGTPFVQACNNAISAGPGGSPALVASLPDGSQMLGAETTNIDSIAVSSFTGACPATPTPNTFAAHALGATTTPRQIIVTPDSQHAYITGSLAGSLPAYASAAGTTSLVTLSSGTATTFTGGSTLDSSTVYVGGSDNKIHVITTSTGVESTTVPLSFTPNLVVVKP